MYTFIEVMLDISMLFYWITKDTTEKHKKKQVKLRKTTYHYEN